MTLSLAEIAQLDLLADVLVGGSHYAHVDRNVAIAAHARDLVLLQRTQHLGLCRKRHVADLVHEQSASVGKLELALALTHGRRERTFFMAEQLALDQLGGYSRAVDLDEGAVAALAAVVHHACDQLLARSRP